MLHSSPRDGCGIIRRLVNYCKQFMKLSWFVAVLFYISSIFLWFLIFCNTGHFEIPFSFVFVYVCSLLVCVFIHTGRRWLDVGLRCSASCIACLRSFVVQWRLHHASGEDRRNMIVMRRA